MTESEYRTFIAARYIAGLLVRRMAKDGRLIKDLRSNPVGFHADQLIHGLCLVIPMDAALELLTPWGRWRFCESKLEVFDIAKYTANMKLGPVPTKSELQASFPLAMLHAVHEAAGWVLSYPKIRPKEKLIAPEEALKRWGKLSDRYFENHPMD